MEQQNQNPLTEPVLKRPLLLTILCYSNLFYFGLLALVLFASIFFYRQFAEILDYPYKAILNVNPSLVRTLMTIGFLVYSCIAFGCVLMIKSKKSGFWWYAIPVFLIVMLSLFVVFNTLNLIQMLFTISSLIVFSTQTRFLK
jgi:hypothetical protein